MKKALVVGINYTGTGQDLKGCLNDAYHVETELKARGFDSIEMLLEKDATTAGMKAALERLVANTAPGDVILFHYSGHGSQLPSKTEKDGFEEILCPIDLNWTTRVITDDHLRTIFDKVPNGVNITLILDCCHSGTALDQDETLGFEAPRDLVTQEPEAGSRYLPPPTKILEKLEDRELVEWSTERDVNKTALLIAGCRSDQTSADAYIDGVHQGAATYALLRSLKASPNITYRGLATEMVQYVSSKGFKQVPQLDGSTMLYDEIFLQPFGMADELAAAPPAPPVQAPVPAPAPAQEKPKKDNKILIIIGVVIAAAMLFFATR